MVKNNLNPEFTESVEVDYRFEEVQKMKFLVYDVDDAVEHLAQQVLLGDTDCSLAQVRMHPVHTHSYYYYRLFTKTMVKNQSSLKTGHKHPQLPITSENQPTLLAILNQN